MKTEHDIETILSTSKPTLDQASRDRLWLQIESRLASSSAIPSPFLFTYIPRKAVSPLLILVIVASTAGVAFASETARPGDLLYPVDRALESARLTVALDEEKKNVLVRSFSEERLRELRAIIEEESRERSRDRDEESVATSSDPVQSLEIEVDIFTDVTVVVVELNDRKTIFTTAEDTETEIVNAIRTRFPALTLEQITLALTLEREDRASRPKDRGEVALSEEGSARVGSALAEVVSFIDASEKDDSDAKRFFKEIADEVEGLNIKLDDERVRIRSDKQRFEWKDEDDKDEYKEEKRIEYWEGSSRVRIEEKDGEVRIEVKESDDTSSDKVWNDDSDDDIWKDEEDEDENEFEDEDEEDEDRSGKEDDEEDEQDEEDEEDHEDEEDEEDEHEDEDRSGKGNGDL